MEDFLKEFHQRLHEEAVAPSGLQQWWSRFTEWVSEPGRTKWIYGGGLAYAVIALGFVLFPRSTEPQGLPLEPARYEVLEPAPVQQLEEVDLSPSSHGSVGEQEF